VSLAVKLKELRKAKKVSLQVAADALEISKQHLWDLEMGNSKNPSVELLKKLADYFEVSVAMLVGEAPDDDEEDQWAVAMFRGLKEVDQADRELIQTIIERNRKTKKGGNKS
jgi:transcriptional regulator with XRE-family HTH domain